MPRTPHISPLSLRPLILAGALLLLCLSSCSRFQSIREARTIVAEADSLRAAGQSLSPSAFHLSPSQSDSCAMADAAATLEPLRLIYPTAYAHANYYYGRLLREAGNHPEAMLAFLRVVHSRTKDYAIKGRAYSNIGSICHLAENYSLSYEMYAKSAEEFLHSGNERAYFYALNDMAYELGTDSLKNQSIQITNQIENECLDSGILTKIWETRANAYLTAKMYDSTLYCICQLQKCGNTEPTGYLFLARAYEGLHNVDSALFYAKKVFNESNYYGDKFNALFILSHYDSTLTSADILSLTSAREDIRYYEYEPGKAKYSEAAQLLQFDLDYKPNPVWLWVFVCVTIFVGLGIILYVRKKKQQQILLSRQIEAEQRVIMDLEARIKLYSEHESLQTQLQQSIERLCALLLKSNNLKEINWTEYNLMCESVNSRFNFLASKLKMYNCLSEREIRLCILVLIGFNRRRTSELLNYSYSGIGKLKDTTAKKLDTTGRFLRDFLRQLVLEI